MTDGANASPGGSLSRTLLNSPLVVAVVAAIVGASPTLYEKFWQVSNGVDKSRAFVTEQNLAWDRNPTCGTVAPMWKPGIKGTQVDALICDRTGDVLVTAKAPSGKVNQYWVPVEIAADLKGAGGDALAFDLLASPAHAALPPTTPRPAPQSAARAGMLELAQVICQTRIDQRTIVRHVRLDNGQCVDVYIDTYSGQEQKRVPVPCKPSC